MTSHLTALFACLAIGLITFAATASLPPHRGDGRAAVVTTHPGDAK